MKSLAKNPMKTALHFCPGQNDPAAQRYVADKACLQMRCKQVPAAVRHPHHESTLETCVGL